MADCAQCTAPTGDDGLLCRTHTDELDRELGDVPELVGELEVTRTRQDRLTERYGAKAAEKPLEWSERAAEKASELWLTLSAWALDLSQRGEDERDRLAAVGTYDTAEVARWLARNMRELRQHPEAGTAFDEITDAIRQARRVVDRPAIATRFEVGPCPEIVAVDPHDDVAGTAPCAGKVWAFIPAEPERAALLQCQACGESWNTTQWLRVGKRMLTRIAQLRAAARRSA